MKDSLKDHHYKSIPADNFREDYLNLFEEDCQRNNQIYFDHRAVFLTDRHNAIGDAIVTTDVDLQQPSLCHRCNPRRIVAERYFISKTDRERTCSNSEFQEHSHRYEEQNTGNQTNQKRKEVIEGIV